LLNLVSFYSDSIQGGAETLTSKKRRSGLKGEPSFSRSRSQPYSSFFVFPDFLYHSSGRVVRYQ